MCLTLEWCGLSLPPNFPFSYLPHPPKLRQPIMSEVSRGWEKGAWGWGWGWGHQLEVVAHFSLLPLLDGWKVPYFRQLIHYGWRGNFLSSLSYLHWELTLNFSHFPLIDGSFTSQIFKISGDSPKHVYVLSPILKDYVPLLWALYICILILWSAIACLSPRPGDCNCIFYQII